MSVQDHEKYMQLALEAAQEAYNSDEVPVGAVAVYHNDVIARSHNQRESHQDPLGHAEIAVITEASRRLGSWRLEDVTLYVTLEPCLMCMGALLQSRVPKLVFGAMDPKAGACGSLYDVSNDARLNHAIEVVSGVLAEESSQLLKKFFQEKRR